MHLASHGLTKTAMVIAHLTTNSFSEFFENRSTTQTQVSTPRLSTRLYYLIGKMPPYKTCRNHFDVVKRIPTSTPNVFSQPRKDNMKPIIGDEQRSYAGPIRWPVIIVHRKSLPRDQSSNSSLFAARAAPVIQDFDFRDSDFVSGDISTNMFARLRLAMEQDNLFTRVKDKHASITFPQNFTIRDGLLFWRRFNNASLYIPPSMPNLRKYIYSQCHGNPIVGHFGIKKTLDRIRRTYWWPGMVRDVKENISKCFS